MATICTHRRCESLYDAFVAICESVQTRRRVPYPTTLRGGNDEVFDTLCAVSNKSAGIKQLQHLTEVCHQPTTVGVCVCGVRVAWRAIA